MVVYADPSADLAPACGLVKNAIVYADKVELVAPAATMLFGLAAMSYASDRELPVVFRSLLDAAGSLNPADDVLLRQWAAVAAKKHRSPAELNVLRTLRSAAEGAMEKFRETASQAIDKHGGGELVPALEAGLLAPLDMGITGDVRDPDLFEVYLERLTGALDDDHSYPLFDTSTATLARAIQAEGQATPDRAALRRAYETAMHDGLLRKLPTFPNASMAEVVDIRRELDGPLRRYRTAIGKLTAEVPERVGDPEFEAQVEAAWYGQVADALDELDELVDENRYLAQLKSQFDTHTIPMAILASTLTYAATATVTAAIGMATAASASLVVAGSQRERAQRVIERKPFFLLHRIDR